jgi:hypothetical protein
VFLDAVRLCHRNCVTITAIMSLQRFVIMYTAIYHFASILSQSNPGYPSRRLFISSFYLYLHTHAYISQIIFSRERYAARRLCLSDLRMHASLDDSTNYEASHYAVRSAFIRVNNVCVCVCVCRGVQSIRTLLFWHFVQFRTLSSF